MKLAEFQLLTDENIDWELLAFLRERGFDVFDIKEEELFRIKDAAILDLSLQTNRVVISQDSDFGTLIFRDNQPFFGVIYLRPGHESPEVHVQTMRAVLESNLEFSTPFVLVAENLGDNVKLRLRLF